MWVLKFNYHTIRFAKGPFKLMCMPVWWLEQVMAPIFDKVDKHLQETVKHIPYALGNLECR